MITYLLDTSALWHLFRTPGALRPWEGHIAAGVFHVCEPTRAEFLYSATDPAHRDELAEDLDDLCHSSPVPKGAWRWVDTAQYKLTQRGQHRSAGAIDLLVCATAVHHGHTVLHVGPGDAFVDQGHVYFVAESVSRSTVGRDCGRKLNQYAARGSRRT